MKGKSYLEHASAYEDRGSSYNNLERYDEAIADLTKYIELSTAKGRKAVLAEGYRKRGKTYRNRGKASSRRNPLRGLDDFDRAIADYTRAIELEPQDSKTYYARSIVYGLKGENALEEADKKKSSPLFAEESAKEAEAEKAKRRQ